MPVIPIITAVAGVAGAVSQINQGNQQQTANQQQYDIQKRQAELAEKDRLNKIASANKFWQEYDNTTVPTYDDSVAQAGNQLNSQYDDQMKTTLQNLGNSLKNRGFYGQLPGDVLTQNAAAKTEAAKQSAISNLATNLYQTGQDRKAALKAQGLSTFGTYGQV